MLKERTEERTKEREGESGERKERGNGEEETDYVPGCDERFCLGGAGAAFAGGGLSPKEFLGDVFFELPRFGFSTCFSSTCYIFSSSSHGRKKLMHLLSLFAYLN